MQLNRAFSSGTLAISLLLPGTAVFAQPPTAVNNYPDNTAAIGIIQLNPLAWLQAFQTALPADAKEMTAELSQMVDKLKQETGMDLIHDGLLNLDQQASFAFRPVAGHMGEGLFQVKVKSEERVHRLFKQAESLLTAESGIKLVKDSFAGIQIYQLIFTQADDQPLSLNIAISKNTVLGSMGSDSGLKEMIYHQFVSPADSRFRLSNTAGFKDAERELGGDSDWVYLRPEQFMPVLAQLMGVPEIDTFLSDPWLQDILHYYHGLGFGVANRQAKLSLKSYIQHQDLSAYQQDYRQALLDLQKLELNELLSRIPEDAILLQTGAQGGVDLASNFPSEHQVPVGAKDLIDVLNSNQWRKNLSAFTGMDFSKEIDPAFDSRYAWGLLKNETKVPDLVMVLGLHANQTNFAQKLASDLKLNYGALLPDASEYDTRYQNASLKNNMHRLQTIVETYAVDWEGGYSADLESLQKEAQSGAYWSDFEHPVYPKQPAILPFSAFKGDPSQIGSVFYEGIGQKSESEGQTFFSSYVVYGYGVDGKLYILTQDDAENLPSRLKALNPGGGGLAYVKENLPTQTVTQESGLKSEQIDTYQELAIYSLPLPEDFQTEFKDLTKAAIQPVFAQQGSQLLLASTPQALKKLIDTQASKHPQIQKNRQNVNPGNHYFYLNMEPVMDILKQIEDKDLKDLSPFIEPIRSVQAASQDSLAHSSTQIDIQLTPSDSLIQNMGGVSLIAGMLAALAVPNFAGAQVRAKQSSTKANMYTFQTILETYSVDWEGAYPDSVADLKNEAQNASDSYWREFSNPFTEESGEGKAYLDYSAYQAGPEQKGLVLYQVSEDRLSYLIYGTDEAGQKIQNDDGDFILSNS